MSIPTIVPRDLLPRPEWTVLRILVSTIIPILVFFALLMQGVPPQYMLIVLLMIGSQVSLAVTQGQKEMLAATTSYFRPGLGRRVGQAQLFWGLAVPATTTAIYGAITPIADAALLGTVFGLVMVIHALMAWATFRLWWAFQLPAWGFYFFFVPLAVRKAAFAGWLLELGRYPLPWLAVGVVSLVLLVRFAASRGLQRRLHDSIVLGPEAIFSPSRIQAYKQQRRHHGRDRVGPAWRRRSLAGLIGRAEAAQRQGDAVGARRWQLLAANLAVNVSPRPWVTRLLGPMVLALMTFFGYLQSSGSMERTWFSGLVYQVALVPAYSLSVVLLSAPMAGLSRRSGFRAEVSALLFATLAAALVAVGLKLASDLMAATMPSITWNGTVRPYAAAPLHGVWLVPMACPFAWLAVALRPRAQCTLSNGALLIGFFIGHGLMTWLPYPVSAPIFGAVSAVVFGGALLRRRRWWRQADLPV